MLDFKYCTKCKITKSVNQFNKNKGHKDGFQSMCRGCHKVNRRNSDLKNKYGITCDDYESLLLIQDGVCARCGAEPTEKQLCVDHDHKTGLIRGLLCSNCNTAIGKLGDNIEGVRSALEYLEFHERSLTQKQIDINIKP